MRNLFILVSFLAIICGLFYYSYSKNTAPEKISWIGTLTYTPGSNWDFQQELRRNTTSNISFDKDNEEGYNNMKWVFSKVMKEKIPYVLVNPSTLSVKDQEKMEYYKGLYGMGDDGEICKVTFENYDVRETSLYKVGTCRLYEIENGVYRFAVEDCYLIK